MTQDDLMKWNTKNPVVSDFEIFEALVPIDHTRELAEARAD
jgi:hypothetical protein